MKSIEFIEMMKNDIETDKDKEQLQSVVMAMEFALKEVGNPDVENTENKTPQKLFEEMKSYAKKNAKCGCFYFSPDGTKKFILDYLGVTATAASKPQKDIFSLEDFF